MAEYHLVYDMLFAKGGSYFFPCDAGGSLLPFPMPSFHANMRRIKANPKDFALPRIEVQPKSSFDDEPNEQVAG